MTVRPAEKKWVALLSVLIVAVLGWIPYYLLVVRPRPAAPQQPATDPEAQKMAAAEAQKMAAAPVSAPGAASANLTPAQTNALLELYSDLNPPLPATRDPFKPPVAAALPPELQDSPPTRSAQTNAPAPPPQNTAREPNYPPLPDAFPPGRITVQPVAPPPLPTIELKGVISGEPSIAVVNIEGQTSYRQEGDTLPGNLRIARITEAGIVLRHGRRNIVLEVGHSTEPSRQAAGSAAPEQESSAPPALTPPDTRDISSAQPEKPTVRLSAVPAAAAPNGKSAAVRPPTRRSAKRPASPRRVSGPALVQTPSAGAPAPASPHTTPSWKSPSAPILTSHSAPVRRYQRARRPAYERAAYSFTGRRL
jgi:hypothetical protein